jgi:peptidoglycan hydrolase-like protein with peptidoglycan-binding domain
LAARSPDLAQKAEASRLLGAASSRPADPALPQAQLNSALKGTGANSLETDGVLGRQTQANMRAYQESRGLAVTGTLNPETQAALDANMPPVPGWSADKSPAIAAATRARPAANAAPVAGASTAGMTQQEKFDHYKGLIEANGGRFNPDGPNIVGVRTPTNANVNGGGGAYDDTFAVITMRNGQPSVQEFTGNTEPAGHYRGRIGVDVDGNGTKDQGRLRAGFYEYSSSTYRGGPALRMRGDSTVDRDTNRDGTFGNDRGASSGGGNSMLFHRGGSTTTGSAGCQTMPRAEFDRFMGALRDAGMRSGTAVGYTLVEVPGEPSAGPQ